MFSFISNMPRPAGQKLVFSTMLPFDLVCIDVPYPLPPPPPPPKKKKYVGKVKKTWRSLNPPWISKFRSLVNCNELIFGLLLNSAPLVSIVWNCMKNVVTFLCQTLSPILQRRSDDDDNNYKVTKSNSFEQQNKNFTGASQFLVHFFPVTARLRRESA